MDSQVESINAFYWTNLKGQQKEFFLDFLSKSSIPHRIRFSETVFVIPVPTLKKGVCQ